MKMSTSQQKNACRALRIKQRRHGLQRKRK